jgi:predicted HAD superfamily Cof-like phosphohydrolase
MTTQEQVRQFHEAFGFHVAAELSAPPEHIRYERARLLVEECAEAVAELLAGHPRRGPLADDLRSLFRDRCEPYDRPADPVKIAHELGDLTYVTAGGAVNCGVPLERVVSEIHRANMTKLGPDGKPVHDRYGKAVKPDGWRPADVAGVLDRWAVDPA